MNDGILIFRESIHLHSHHRLLHTVLALAAAHGVEVVTHDDWNVPSKEEMVKDLLLKFEAPKLSVPEEPFIPKETAWERRNSNAPWYRRFQNKRRRR